MSVGIRLIKFPNPPNTFPPRVLKLKPPEANYYRMTIPLQNKIAPLTKYIKGPTAVMDSASAEGDGAEDCF